MSTSTYADAADSGAGAGRVQADTETLPHLATKWRALLDIPLVVPQQIPSYPATDLASSEVHSAMADWPAIQEHRITQRNAAADELMAWVGKTSGAFTFTDQGGADTISSAGTKLA